MFAFLLCAHMCFPNIIHNVLLIICVLTQSLHSNIPLFLRFLYKENFATIRRSSISALQRNTVRKRNGFLKQKT